MNLNNLAGRTLSVINPRSVAQLYASTGYTTGADGSQIPAYAAPVTVLADVRALSGSDLRQVGGININTVMNAIYISSAVLGVVRPQSQGGDKIVIDGQTWFVTLALENWPDWSKVAAALQVNA